MSNRDIDFTFTTTDPEGDDVYYLVEWGDGTDSGWLGPFSSGTGTTVSHKWTEEAELTIRAKAKDEGGSESDWTTFAFTAPRDRAKIFDIFDGTLFNLKDVLSLSFLG